MDLGQPDRMLIGSIGIPILAILVVITTFIQSKIMQPPTQGGANDQSAAMNSSMTMMMPLMMGWMAYQFSAGLALYFLTSNVTTIVQYAALGRADWSKILPWVQPKETGKITPVIDLEDDDDEEEEQEVVKTVKPSARSAAKRKRPKRKK